MNPVRATSVLPNFGPPSLFKGHLSTKSNAFCTDSSSLRLSTLQLVKNHMAVHYNKILSAKAAVDCSVPVSMTTSIKYADQQRREKLKKDLTRCEKEFKITKNVMQTNSKNNSKSFFKTIQKPSGEPQEDVFIEEVNGSASLAKSLVSSTEGPLPGRPKSGKVLGGGTETCSSTLTCMDHTASRPHRSSSGPLYGRRPRSTFPNSHRFQLVISKAPSGDLLEKHSELFSNKELPFTPRTLKTEAKSFLSQYRYYMPARRRKGFTDEQVEAETQTEFSSFHSGLGTAKSKNLTNSEGNIQQASSRLTRDTAVDKSPVPRQGPGRARGMPEGSPSRRLSPSKEELSYLSFIEDITDEILKLGLFSDRFLERLFEQHITQNKHHLEEEKMRQLLHGLKADLGCTHKEDPLKLTEASVLNLLDFEKALSSTQNGVKSENGVAIEQERHEYQTALNMLLSAPKEEAAQTFSPPEFFMPIHKSKCSPGVIIQQVNKEKDPERSTCDDNLSASDSLTDQETSVNVIEDDSDTDKLDTFEDFSCLSTSLSESVRFSSVRGHSNHDKESPASKITEMSIEDCPSDV
ncbi:spermatogenesis-associated protein 7 isoform X2 [Ochotona princeps]|uniref:spermatogenesis-associated protein 7 isoform X2 n=1 Tax=Ochotona princeps TaxID=9978 RepID=UPI0027148330|nr:spermatogenesis-associated protein 7 isoform X2 [Ochotona princeps]